MAYSYEPDLACGVNIAAQVTEKSFNKEEIHKLNKVVTLAQRYSNHGIILQQLGRESLEVIVYYNASFANNLDIKFQLGYIIRLADKYERCNSLHFACYKSRRTARSIPGAEIYAHADDFDYR